MFGALPQVGAGFRAPRSRLSPQDRVEQREILRTSRTAEPSPQQFWSTRYCRLSATLPCLAGMRGSDVDLVILIIAGGTRYAADSTRASGGLNAGLRFPCFLFRRFLFPCRGSSHFRSWQDGCASYGARTSPFPTFEAGNGSGFAVASSLFQRLWPRKLELVSAHRAAQPATWGVAMLVPLFMP